MIEYSTLAEAIYCVSVLNKINYFSKKIAVTHSYKEELNPKKIFNSPNARIFNKYLKVKSEIQFLNKIYIENKKHLKSLKLTSIIFLEVTSAFLVE